MPFHRYVALGDSLIEGVGDPDATRPNGLRGWADRVAEVLAGACDEFGYANLAIRGRKLHAILDEQLEPALALRPDLVTIYAGSNDILRPRVDLDALVADYDADRMHLGPAGHQRMAIEVPDTLGVENALVPFDSPRHPMLASLLATATSTPASPGGE